MPEYNCVNIGVDGYPVWLTLSEKAIIVAIEPSRYLEMAAYSSSEQFLMKTTVSLAVDGCSVELKTPATVESVCRIIGFVWDEADVVAEGEGKPAETYKSPPPEEAKPEGGGPS